MPKSERSVPPIQDVYPPDYSYCYGCGRSNEQGLRLKSVWTGAEAVARYRPRPHEISVPGYVYGGLVASLADCHAMATAAAHVEHLAGRVVGAAPAPRYVTASLKVDFLRPTPLGPELLVRGRVVEIGRRKVVVSVCVEADGIETARGEVIAVPIPESMTSARTPGA